MRFFRAVFAFVAALLLFAVAPTARADSVIYTYTGNDFTQAGGSGNWAGWTSDYITATLEFESPLCPYGCTEPGLLSWSVSIAGTSYTYGETYGSPVFAVGGAIDSDGFSFAEGAGANFDASGNITNWNFSYVFDTPDCALIYCADIDSTPGGDVASVYLEDSYTGEAENYNDQGTWSMTTVSSVPEPSTTVMALDGATLLIAIRRRKLSSPR